MDEFAPLAALAPLALPALTTGLRAAAPVAIRAIGSTGLKAGLRAGGQAGLRAAAPVLKSTVTTAAKTAGTKVAKKGAVGAGNLARRGLKLVSDKLPGAEEPQDTNQSPTVDQQQRQRLAASTEIPRLMRIRLMEDDDDEGHAFEHPFIQKARDASDQPKRDITTALANVRKTNATLRRKAQSPKLLKLLRKHGPKVLKMLARKFNLPGV